MAGGDRCEATETSDFLNQKFQILPNQLETPDRDYFGRGTSKELTRAEIELSIPARLDSLVKQYGKKPAIVATNHNQLTYAELFQEITGMVAMLNNLGIGRGDRVALVTANGLPMAVTFLGIIAGAVCAPINPALKQQEFASIFTDLRPKALVVEAGTDTAALGAAKRASIPIIQWPPPGDTDLGLLLDVGEISVPATRFGFAGPDDVALMLFTSGTTARPKLVPLTHANLMTSAYNIGATFQLTPSDRCLNVMPLFHIHGLVGGLLASLATAGSVICPTGFNATEFFTWLEAFDPSWYTAVPTMHQAILARAEGNFEIIGKHPLRFIRSSSAAMPAHVMQELENIFAAPVIESYGMTEASHQMASNPLPPYCRKRGSVGKAAGPEVAIMDEAGNLQPAGKTGEVVIRGTNVMGGYINNDVANAASFAYGWFRTGDQGYLDGDGYLFLTGRIKELINRAGEKISPREVDDVLLAHPAVEQAVTFAVPHPALGEEVAAAVVLRRDKYTTTRQLTEFAATQLADFKVPKQIVIVEEIPKGPTGKLQRAGLAAKLGITATHQTRIRDAVPYEEPKGELEKRIAEIWKRVLRLEHVGRHDNFFHLGGYSLLAVELIREVEKRFEKQISAAVLFSSPTIAELARLILKKSESTVSPLIPVQLNGSKPAFFCAHGTDSYLQLASYLGSDQPFYGLAQHLEGRAVRYIRIEDIATHYLSAVRAVQPKGPYYIGGHSIGGLIAFEMAQQLLQQGQEIGLLVLLDTRPPWNYPSHRNDISGQVDAQLNLPSLSVRRLKRHMYLLRETLKKALTKNTKTIASRVYHGLGKPLPPKLQAFYVDQIVHGQVYPLASKSYRPFDYLGPAVYIGSEETPYLVAGWTPLMKNNFKVHLVPGNHLSMLEEPNLQRLAETLNACLTKAQEEATPTLLSRRTTLVNQQTERVRTDESA